MKTYDLFFENVSIKGNNNQIDVIFTMNEYLNKIQRIATVHMIPEVPLKAFLIQAKKIYKCRNVQWSNNPTDDQFMIFRTEDELEDLLELQGNIKSIKEQVNNLEIKIVGSSGVGLLGKTRNQRIIKAIEKAVEKEIKNCNEILGIQKEEMHGGWLDE